MWRNVLQVPVWTMAKAISFEKRTKL